MKYPCSILDEGEVWVHVFLYESYVYIKDYSLKGAPHPLCLYLYGVAAIPPLIALCLSPGLILRHPPTLCPV